MRVCLGRSFYCYGWCWGVIVHFTWDEDNRYGFCYGLGEVREGRMGMVFGGGFIMVPFGVRYCEEFELGWLGEW